MPKFPAALAVVKDEPKPLSAEEATRLIEETRKKLIDAVDRGDLETWRALSVDQDFYQAALDAAREREQREAEAAREREREALRPEAERAVLAANPATIAKSQIDKMRAAFAVILDALREVPAEVGAFKQAQEEAVRLAPVARVPYAGPVAVDDALVGRQILRAWDEAVAAANLPRSTTRYLPGLKIADAVSAAFTFPMRAQ